MATDDINDTSDNDGKWSFPSIDGLSADPQGRYFLGAINLEESQTSDVPYVSASFTSTEIKPTLQVLDEDECEVSVYGHTPTYTISSDYDDNLFLSAGEGMP